MNIGRRIVAVLGALAAPVVDIFSKKQQAGPEITETGKIKKAASKLVRVIRLRLPGKTGIFGPAFLPDAAGHHVSRQACRARLRGVMFDRVSKMYPNLSRRDRRRHASLAARLEYRRMMADETNAIPDDERRLLERLARVA